MQNIRILLSLVLSCGVAIGSSSMFDIDSWSSTPIDSPVYAYGFGGGTFVIFSKEAILSSKNGIDWNSTQRSNLGLYRLKYLNGKFVVVGGSDGGATTGAPGFSVFGYSEDGNSWQFTTNNSDGGEAIPGVAFGNGKYMAFGGHNFLFESTDGIDWQNSGKRDDPWGDLTGALDMEFGNGVFVLVSGFPGRAWTSTDGAEWRGQASGLADRGIQRVIFGNGAFVAWYPGTGEVVSRDGVVWNEISTMPPVSDVTFGNGRFYAVAQSSMVRAQIFSSLDGEIWEKLSTLPETGPITQRLIAGDGHLIAIRYQYSDATGSAYFAALSPAFQTLTAEATLDGVKLHIFGEPGSLLSVEVSPTVAPFQWAEKAKLSIESDGSAFLSVSFTDSAPHLFRTRVLP